MSICLLCAGSAAGRPSRTHCRSAPTAHVRRLPETHAVRAGDGRLHASAPTASDMTLSGDYVGHISIPAHLSVHGIQCGCASGISMKQL